MPKSLVDLLCRIRSLLYIAVVILSLLLFLPLLSPKHLPRLLPLYLCCPINLLWGLLPVVHLLPHILLPLFCIGSSINVFLYSHVAIHLLHIYLSSWAELLEMVACG